MKVIRCLSCAGIFHSVTPLFNTERAWHGAMFKLLPDYGPHGKHWSSFPEESFVRDAELECPGCGSPYTRMSIKLVEVASEEEAKPKRPEAPQSQPKGKGKR